ncbi:MAG TPA: hypothetical protein VKB85_11870 [Propionibacteriaceae bacterium]|nr:hypothetical protein [Propionibacteriaceae bacterium]
MAAPRARAVGCLVLAVVLMVGLAVGAFLWLRSRGLTSPVPGQQRCVATASGNSVTLDLEQAHYASIVVGMSVKRGLPPRAASIAMATVYQETGIRNLNYGDLDSVGLFQQRPSQGWGSRKQLLDPYYATDKFYDALVKIDDWETADITTVAQRIQNSSYPDAYRDHEADARVLASALTGHSTAGFTCLERAGRSGKPSALVSSIEKTFGAVSDKTKDKVVGISARSGALAWAYAGHALANADRYGVVGVKVDGRQWQTDGFNLPTWTKINPGLKETRVEITFR